MIHMNNGAKDDYEIGTGVHWLISVQMQATVKSVFPKTVAFVMTQTNNVQKVTVKLQSEF